MMLEIVIYLIVVLGSTIGISMCLESATKLVVTLGSDGKRDFVGSLMIIAFSHYFFKECTGYFKPNPRFDLEFWYFLIASLLILGVITGTRECVNYRRNDTDTGDSKPKSDIPPITGG